MAQGDTINGLSSVAVGGIFDIKPASGAEWVVHNVYYNGVVEFYITDGTNSLKFDSDNSGGARLGAVYHCTSTQWLQIKNTDTVSLLIAFDGMQTK